MTTCSYIDKYFLTLTQTAEKVAGDGQKMVADVQSPTDRRIEPRSAEGKPWLPVGWSLFTLSRAEMSKC